MFIGKIGKNGRIYKVKDLAGLKVGSYTIVKRSETKIRSSSNRCVMWAAICECGTIRELEYGNIMSAKKKIENGDVSIFSCGCKSSLPFGVSASKAAYRNYCKGAESRGYEFNISWYDFLNITKCNCYYCGSLPKNRMGRTERKRGNGHYIYNGMDRVDNTKGYYLNNVVPCCRKCNRAKDIMGGKEFLEWVSSVYNHCIKVKGSEFIPHVFGNINFN